MAHKLLALSLGAVSLCQLCEALADPGAQWCIPGPVRDGVHQCHGFMGLVLGAGAAYVLWNAYKLDKAADATVQKDKCSYDDVWVKLAKKRDFKRGIARLREVVIGGDSEDVGGLVHPKFQQPASVLFSVVLLRTVALLRTVLASWESQLRNICARLRLGACLGVGAGATKQDVEAVAATSPMQRLLDDTVGDLSKARKVACSGAWRLSRMIVRCCYFGVLVLVSCTPPQAHIHSCAHNALAVSRLKRIFPECAGTKIGKIGIAGAVPARHHHAVCRSGYPKRPLPEVGVRLGF